MRFYFDHHATTPVDPTVLAAMLPYFSEHFGNSMSTQHAMGWKAHQAVETARKQVAGILGAEAREIVFTGGATESVHLAIFGVFHKAPKPSHMITSAVDHKCVLECAHRLEEQGHEVTILPVNSFGQITADQVRAAKRENTILVSIMHANNEIGSVNPIAEIAQVCQELGVLLHVDGAQTVGRIPIDLKKTPLDLYSLSAHKFYGPKGVGALYVRQAPVRVRLSPYLMGSQEKGLRGGTQNVPAIVGLGAAAELAGKNLVTETARLAGLRDQMRDWILANIPGSVINGHLTERLCNNISATFSDVLPEQVLLNLSSAAFSSASACSAGTGKSHVLAALGQADDPRLYTLRFGLGRSNTSEQIQEFLPVLKTAVERARAK